MLKDWRARRTIGHPDTRVHDEPMSEVSNSLQSGSGSNPGVTARPTTPITTGFANDDAAEEAEVAGPTYVEFEVPLVDDDDEEDVENIAAPPAKLPAAPRTTIGRVSSRSRAPPIGGTLKQLPTRVSRRLASNTNMPSAPSVAPGPVEKSSYGGPRKRVKQ